MQEVTYDSFSAWSPLENVTMEIADANMVAMVTQLDGYPQLFHSANTQVLLTTWISDKNSL